MENKNVYSISIAVVVLLVVFVAGYALLKMPKTANAPVTQGVAIKDTILFTQGVSGQQDHFTDANGITLYHYLKDFSVSGKQHPYSMCEGECSTMWPPFYAENIVVSAPLVASEFTEFTREDGGKQTAWRGWPMYYYSGDHNIGDTNGQSIENVWYMGILIHQ